MAITAALALTGGSAAADSGAHGSTYESSGFLSGNVIQLPIHVPIDLCGNTLNVIGLLNPAFGSECGGGSAHRGENWASEGHEHGDHSEWEEAECPDGEPAGYGCCECVEDPMPEPTGDPTPEPTDDPMPQPTSTLPAPAPTSALSAYRAH
ncbi:chaplin family protein [Streptomyces roseus]|uniref:chaplin family protein n=1 Tax=Streptomyces roseus TaxID=66430 RepID=UPI0038213AD9